MLRVFQEWMNHTLSSISFFDDGGRKRSQFRSTKEVKKGSPCGRLELGLGVLTVLQGQINVDVLAFGAGFSVLCFPLLQRLMNGPTAPATVLMVPESIENMPGVREEIAFCLAPLSAAVRLMNCVFCCVFDAAFVNLI